MSDSQDKYENFIQLRPSDVLIYCLFVGTRVKKIDTLGQYLSAVGFTEEKKAFSNTQTYTGQFTKSARLRMRCALDVLIMLSPKQNIYNPIIKKSHPFQLSFITLTYSCTEIVDYRDSQLLLEKFLKWLKNTAGAHVYVWRLELQKRGQIHYHIVCDQFIKYDRLRDKWNMIQRNAGLIPRGMNPNSTDIKSALSINDVSAYVAKYMTKDGEENKNYSGSQIKKFWGCSQNIQGVKRPSFSFKNLDKTASSLENNLISLVGEPFEVSAFSHYYSNRHNPKPQSLSRLCMRFLGIEKDFREWQKSILPDKFAK